MNGGESGTLGSVPCGAACGFPRRGLRRNMILRKTMGRDSGNLPLSPINFFCTELGSYLQAISVCAVCAMRKLWFPRFWGLTGEGNWNII